MKNIITKLSDLALMLLAVVIGVGIALFAIFAPPAALIVAIVILGIAAIWLYNSCKNDLKTFIEEHPDFEDPGDYER